MADEAYDAVMPAKVNADETNKAHKADGAIEANVTNRADEAVMPAKADEANKADELTSRQG